jgi:hypothetical protein
MSASNEKTWANLLRSGQTEAEQDKGPTTFDKITGALAGIGAAGAGSAIEKGFTGTGEFISRLFGLPEHGPDASHAERQTERADRDRDQGMDR